MGLGHALDGAKFLEGIGQIVAVKRLLHLEYRDHVRDRLDEIVGVRDLASFAGDDHGVDLRAQRSLDTFDETVDDANVDCGGDDTIENVAGQPLLHRTDRRAMLDDLVVKHGGLLRHEFSQQVSDGFDHIGPAASGFSL